MNDYQFSIPRARLILMALCLVAMQILLYVAGVATGFLIAPGSGTTEKDILAKAAAERTAAKTAVKTETAKAEAAKPQTAMTAEKSAVPAPEAVAGKTTEAAAASSGSPDKTAMPASASASGATGDSGKTAAAATLAQTDEADRPVLAIQVASFLEEDRATNFAEVLRRNGFSPVSVGQLDRASQTWHFVTLGPYRGWDRAAQVSAEVDRSYDLHTYIRLVKATN